MLVSIIMPVYNAAPFLEECLDSIIRQSHEQWELLAVDDGSTDSSLTILKTYAKRDHRIKAIALKKSGIIPCLQLGFEQSKGDLITRMDADDHMPEHKLALMKSAWEEKGKGHLVTGRVAYFSDQPLGEGYLKYAAWINQMVLDQSHYQYIYKECVIPSCAWMIHRADFENCGGFNSDRYPEDYDLCFRFYQNGIKVVCLDELLHFWRDHPERSSRNDPNYLDNKFLDIKLHYFLNIELNKGGNLTLWGAGKKGKTIAKYLINSEVEFNWITNNQKKIGKDIYGKTVRSCEDVHPFKPKDKIILAIANPDEQNELRTQLESQDLTEGETFYFFA